MTLVSGPLKIMTDKPSRVSEVWVGSPQTRPHGGGLLVEERDKVTPVGGVLSFTSVPGPVLLTLVSGGRVVDSVKGIVPDAATATLAEVVSAEHTWTPEQLTAFQQLTAQAKAAAQAAEADRIQTGKDRTAAANAADLAVAIADPDGVLTVTSGWVRQVAGLASGGMGQAMIAQSEISALKKKVEALQTTLDAHIAES